MWYLWSLAKYRGWRRVPLRLVAPLYSSGVNVGCVPPSALVLCLSGTASSNGVHTSTNRVREFALVLWSSFAYSLCIGLLASSFLFRLAFSTWLILLDTVSELYQFFPLRDVWSPTSSVFSCLYSHITSEAWVLEPPFCPSPYIVIIHRTGSSHLAQQVDF